MLLAYSFFGTGLAKATAPGAAVIQFFGGIHEIYFPYVLAKPKLLLGTIAGGMVGIGTLAVFGAGLRAPAAPGSIIAVFAQTPGGSFVGVALSVLLAATTSFLICSLLLRLDRNKDEVDLAAATAEMEALKGKKSSVAGMLLARGAPGAGARGRRRSSPRSGTRPARAGSRSTTSSSPATPAWGPARWAPRCSATRSRRPGSPTSR